MKGYDYEAYFSKEKKLEYWSAKSKLDKKYLVPLVDSSLSTLNVGAGFFVEQTVLQLNKVVCMDISQEAVQKLKEQGVIAIQYDLTQPWPFEDNHFDQILALDIFEHLGHIDSFVHECYRVCKPMGRFVLALPLLNYWKNYLRLLSGTTQGVQYDEHPRMFFDKDIRVFFSNAGFKLIRAKYIGVTRGYGYYLFSKK